MARVGAQVVEAVGVEADIPLARCLHARRAAVAAGDGDAGEQPAPVLPLRRIDVEAGQQIAFVVALEDGEAAEAGGADAGGAQAHHVGAGVDPGDRKSTRLNSSHQCAYRMPSFACKKTTKHITNKTSSKEQV